MMNKELFIASSLVFFLLVPIAFAQVPGTWMGYAYTDGSIAANGTVISALANNVSSTEVKTSIAGPEYSTATPAGYYSISIEAGSSDMINFKVCGIYVPVAAQTWSEGPHYNGTVANFNLSVSKLATGASCSYSCGCSGNYCCSGATEYTDGSGTGTCQASVCTAPTTTGTTGGGGGGGTTTNVTIIPSASPSSPAVINIGTDQSNALKVYQVTVRVTENVSNAQITVKDASLPAGASFAISSDQGATYKYLNITSTIPNSKIANVTIKFKVEKSWITANDINSSTIALERYVNGQWVKLTTTKLSEDSTYIYFEAQSPGLSVFVITGEKNITQSVTPPTCPTCLQPSSWSACADNKQTRTNYKCDATTNYACQSYTETKDCKKPTLGWIWILAIVIFIAAIAWLVKLKSMKKR